MAEWKGASEKQKQEWKEARQEKEAASRERIDQMLASFQDNPENITEYLRFAARFPSYSPRNTMLIYAQNPHAVFVQSFQAWKEKEAAFVKKGEHGLSIFVPVLVTVLETEEGPVQLKYASKEQKEAYKRGEIKGETETRFRLGTVFDISQTTFPPERYPELFHMGYESSQHGRICTAVEKYSGRELQIPVLYHSLGSISLRGYYNPDRKEIHINELLQDTERLSTLTHELGHALAEHAAGDGKSEAQREYEGDCISILIQEHCGIEITDSRMRHFSIHYEKFMEELTETLRELPQEERGRHAGRRMTEAFSSVFRIYSDASERLQPYLAEAAAMDETLAQELNDVQLISGFLGVPEEEAELLAGTEDGYGIYQLAEDESLLAYQFEGYHSLLKNGLTVQKDNYELLYKEGLPEDMTLDDIFRVFNLERPEGFTGHSLSVSDVVVLYRNGKSEAHYVDRSGFQKLPGFLPDNQLLRIIKEKPEQTACRFGNVYMEMHACEGGYDYTIYDMEYRELDGGVYDNPDVNIMQALFDTASDYPDYISYDNENRKFQVPIAAVEDYETFAERCEYFNQPLPSRTSGSTEPEKGLNGNSKAAAEEFVLAVTEAYAYEQDLDVDILAARVYGSRTREALWKKDSDLDVAVCYRGDMSEDAFFNSICNTGYHFRGLRLDINPIRMDKTGTLEAFMERSEAYLDAKEEELHKLENEIQDGLEGEPRVTILWTESGQLQDGRAMGLFQANTLMDTLDKEKHEKYGNGYYDKTAFRIDFIMDGVQRHYEGRYDLGDGDGTLIEHIEKHHTYEANDKEWHDFLIRKGWQKQLEKEKEVRDRVLNEVIPYFKMHCNLSGIEQAAKTALQYSESMDSASTAYYTALLEYAAESRVSLNQGNYELPAAPKRADFDKEIQDYKKHVLEEIELEAAEAGMTVDEYAANGYEPYRVPVRTEAVPVIQGPRL